MANEIEDLLLYIDIPVLDSSENIEYIDQIEYQLFEYARLYYFEKTDKKILMEKIRIYYICIHKYLQIYLTITKK